MLGESEEGQPQDVFGTKLIFPKINLRYLTRIWSVFSVSKLPDVKVDFRKLLNVGVVDKGNLSDTEEMGENNVSVSERR